MLGAPRTKPGASGREKPRYVHAMISPLIVVVDVVVIVVDVVVKLFKFIFNLMLVY